MKKKIVGLSVAAAVIISLVATGTLAQFTDTEGPAPVTITTGTVDIAVGPGEDFDFENPWIGSFSIPDVKPCETHWIEFVIKNVGTNPVVVWKTLSGTPDGCEDGEAVWPPDGMFDPEVPPICSSEPEYVASGGTFDEFGYPTGDYEAICDFDDYILYDMHVLVEPADGEDLLAPGALTTDENKWWQMQFSEGLDLDYSITDLYDYDVILGSIPPGGTMTVWQSYHLMFPDDYDGDVNAFQGDCITFDITLFAQQVEGTQMLMENKIEHPDDWLIVWDDDDDGFIHNIDATDTFGTLDYNSTGPTFDYTFNGYGLDALAGDVEYNLVWYKEGWDAWGGEVEIIDTGTASGGELELKGSHDFGVDLVGAKIWLVPTDNISGDDPTIISSWAMDDFLFETHIIYYDDTDYEPAP